MKQLILTFLKIFFRNRRAIFFVILLPIGLFLVLSFLRLENVIQFDAGQSYTDFLLPGIIAYAIMNAGIYTSSYSLIDLKKQMVLKRLSVTPISAGEFLYAHSVARFVVSLVQAGTLISVGALFFDLHLARTIIILPLVLLVGCMVFLNFGYVIAALARDYEEAAPYTTIVGLGLSFIGDVFFPASNLPGYLQSIGSFLPMQPLSQVMRYALFGTDSQFLVTNLIVLLAWLMLGFALANAIFAKKAYK